MWLLHTYEKPTLSTIHGIVYRQFFNAPLPKPMVHLLRYTKKSGSVYCCRGRRNRTSVYGTQSINVFAACFHNWKRKNTSCCHYTIPQKLWSFSLSAPFSLNLRRKQLNDHLFMLQDSNLHLRSPRPAWLPITPNRFYEVSSLLITHPARLSCSVFSNATYWHCADAFGLSG